MRPNQHVSKTFRVSLDNADPVSMSSETFVKRLAAIKFRSISFQGSLYNVPPPSINTMLEALSSQSLLASLYFKRCKLEQPELLKICDMVDCLPVLKCLELSNSNITNTCVDRLGHLIATNSSISALHLQDNPIEVDTIEPLLHGLLTNTSLTDLSFPSAKEKVDSSIVRNCFRANKTLTQASNCQDFIRRFVWLNAVKAGPSVRERVPDSMSGDGPVDKVMKDFKEQTVEWRVMKIIVLGNGRIGKTTLVNFLKELQEPDQDRRTLATASTVGIERSNLNFGKGIISVWDFAGQTEYTVTHQFFLSKEMVLYIVCFNLGASAYEQMNQITMWLGYLTALLCSSKSTLDHLNAKWRVILVGTCSDVQRERSIITIGGWQGMFPYLPLVNQIFSISILDKVGKKKLNDAIDELCKNILDFHSKRIPMYYKDLLEEVKCVCASNMLHRSVLEEINAKYWNNSNLHKTALAYLHEVGEIVSFGEGMICIDPSTISKIMAKFIAPTDVRNLRAENNNKASILTPRDVAAVLGITEQAKSGNLVGSLVNDLELMVYFGICFELPMPLGSSQSLYMFPSLGENVTLKFSLEPTNFLFYGIRAKAANDTIFVPGITDGQLMLYMKAEEPQSILFLAMTSNPDFDLERMQKIFKTLIDQKFPQSDGYSVEQLCPKCIEAKFGLHSTSDELIFDIGLKDHKCLVTTSRPKLAQMRACRAHNMLTHDCFINYRVSTEGFDAIWMAVVQVLYEHLSVQKRDSGDSIFVFWDKKCLNYGQNWEREFVYAIQNSNIIVLLISLKALDGIRQTAATKQDNVLLEYVLPVFVGEATTEPGKFERFSIRAVGNFPDKPHVRGHDADSIIKNIGSFDPKETEFLGSISKTMEQHRGQKREELEAISEQLMQILNLRYPVPVPEQHRYQSIAASLPIHSPDPSNFSTPMPAVNGSPILKQVVPLKQGEVDLKQEHIERLANLIDVLQKKEGEQQLAIQALQSQVETLQLQVEEKSAKVKNKLVQLVTELSNELQNV